MSKMDLVFSGVQEDSIAASCTKSEGTRTNVARERMSPSCQNSQLPGSSATERTWKQIPPPTPPGYLGLILAFLSPAKKAKSLGHVKGSRLLLGVDSLQYVGVTLGCSETPQVPLMSCYKQGADFSLPMTAKLI